MNPARVPGLRRTEILVGLHDHIVPGVNDRLRATFAPTHHPVLLRHEDALVKTVMMGGIMKHRLLRRTVERLWDEGREATMQWLHLRPNA